ncbi:hypothetical protein TNCT6_37720 [Streptomyces sp. 6-11-2]|nr:hypothetical protein TNCT6_37720 [Streptomyces sp. 6-11-2]
MPGECPLDACLGSFMSVPGNQPTRAERLSVEHVRGPVRTSLWKEPARARAAAPGAAARPPGTAEGGTKVGRNTRAAGRSTRGTPQKRGFRQASNRERMTCGR